MSELALLGISHKTAPVSLREKLALSDLNAKELLSALIESGVLNEGVVLSTCNRTEVYFASQDPVAAEAALLTEFAKRTGVGPTTLAAQVYSLKNCAVAEHLFRVTAGLESMIVGETEIQSQVKAAYDLALNADLTKALLNRLFRAGLEAGKRVRSQTEISRHRLSVASVAVSLADSIIDDLTVSKVVILGAGETAEKMAEALAAEGVGTIFVANRHQDRALSLAQRFEGSAVSFDRLPQVLAEADIVLASTASPHPILEAAELRLVMDNRSDDRPLLLIDIAVPRDIEHSCTEIENVTLYDIDDLQQVVERNRDIRKAEATKATEIIADELNRFANWLGTLEILPTIQALTKLGETAATSTLNSNIKNIELSDTDSLEQLELLAHTVARKLLHVPIKNLKALPEDRRHAFLQMIRELFELEDHRALKSLDQINADVIKLSDSQKHSHG